jgi:hypothetical protein
LAAFFAAGFFAGAAAAVFFAPPAAALRATRAFFFTCDLRRFIFIELRRSKFPMTLQMTRPASGRAEAGDCAARGPGVNL